MGWTIFEYENDYITTTKELIAGVPSLKFKPKGYEGLLPTVIFYHGWHSSKEFMRFKAFTIALHGYQVIVPDALHHGERNPIDYDAKGSIEKYMWKIVLQSTTEAKRFIEELVSKHAANPERLAVCGSSMGGMTAGGVFTDNPSIKCLVGFNGAFSWVEAIAKGYLPKVVETDKELLKGYDPMNNEDKIKGRPILILHGIEDTSVPIECQRSFYENMLPLYAETPELLQFGEEERIDHKITVGMLEDAVSWFKKYL